MFKKLGKYMEDMERGLNYIFIDEDIYCGFY